MTDEEAAIIFAKATGCGLGGYDANGNVCTVLCDDPQLDDTAKFDKCDCRIGAKAIMAAASSPQPAKEG